MPLDPEEEMGQGTIRLGLGVGLPIPRGIKGGVAQGGGAARIHRGGILNGSLVPMKAFFHFI